MALKKSNPKERPGRGGYRIGAGRKPGWGEGLTKTIQVCVTPAQAEAFKTAGGPKWLRAELELRKLSERRESFIKAAEGAGNELGGLALQSFPVRSGSPDAAFSDYGKAGTLRLNDLIEENAGHTLFLFAPDNALAEAGIDQGDLLVVNAHPDLLMRLDAREERLMLLETGAGDAIARRSPASVCTGERILGVLQYIVKPAK